MGRGLFASLFEELLQLDKRIESFDKQLASIHRQSPQCRRIAEVEGIGPITATALVAAICDGKSFTKRKTAFSLARPSAAATFERRQAPSTRDQQARRSVFADVVDPRCAIGGVSGKRQDGRAQPVDCREAGEAGDAENMRCGRQQERQDRLGPTGARGFVPKGRIEFPTHGLQEIQSDGAIGKTGLF